MSNTEPAAELVRNYQAGDDDAAGDLFERYSERLAGLAATMLSERRVD